MTDVLLAVPGARSLADVLGGEPTALGGALARWLPSQRWFPLKSGDIHRVEVSGWCPLDPPAQTAMVLLRVEAREQEPVWLQLLLGLRRPATPAAAVTEGFRDGAAAHAFAVFVTGGTSAAGPGLRLAAAWDGEPSPLRPRPLAVEQSNSSLRLGSGCVVKLYRRVRFGPNPEVELLRYLTAAGFGGVPRLRGRGEGAAPAGTFDAWLAQEFLPRATDGWAWFQARLQRRIGGQQRLAGDSRALGALTAHLHVALSRARAEGMAPQPLDRRQLTEMAAAEADAAQSLAAKLAAAGHDAAPVARAVAALRRWRAPLGDLGLAVRVHGDYHLGQVLRSRGRWYVTDFEGEPARPLAERRALQSPLVDVAGMLRSFDYAVHVAGAGASAADPLRNSFLAAYREPAGAVAGLLPPSPALEQLLAFFELRKALYEVRYEADNRPSWVSIPLAAVARLAEGLA